MSVRYRVDWKKPEWKDYIVDDMPCLTLDSAETVLESQNDSGFDAKIVREELTEITMMTSGAKK